MRKKYTAIAFFMLLAFYSATHAQARPANIYKAYQRGLDLMEHDDYNAAAEQFSLVECAKVEDASVFPCTLWKENAAYYKALCASKLRKSNTVSLFLRFVQHYPYHAKINDAYYQIASCYFRQCAYAKAIVWFKKVKAHHLEKAIQEESLFQTAYAFLQEKDYANAQLLFAQLKDRKGHYAEFSTYYYAYASYQLFDYTGAMHALEQLETSAAYKDIYTYYKLVFSFLNKEYDQVIAYATNLLKATNPEHEAQLYRLVAASYFAKSDYKTALSFYKAFQAKDYDKTQNNQDTYQIGFSWFKLNRYTEAIAELEKMNKLDIYYQYGMMILGKAFLMGHDKRSARIAFFKASKLDFNPTLQEEGLLNYAKLSYELDLQLIALEAIQTYLNKYPHSLKIEEVKTLLAQMLTFSKNYRKAMDVLEAIPDKNVDAKLTCQKVSYYRGLAFYKERAFDNAMAMFIQSVNNAVDVDLEVLAIYWLAEAMYETHKYKESVHWFEKFLSFPAAKNTSVYHYANYALGYAAFKNEDYNKALTYFKRFLLGKNLDEQILKDANLRLADAYFVLKEYNLALEQYHQVIFAHASGEDYALFQVAMIQGVKGEMDSKIASLQLLLKRCPSSKHADNAKFEIAYTYFMKGDYDKAKSDLIALIENHPYSSYIPKALVTIGLVLYSQDNNAAALSIFKRVVESYPTMEEAKQALEAIKNIYLSEGNAAGYAAYTNHVHLKNLSSAEQDQLTFEAANHMFQKGRYQDTYDAVNAYFDRFSKPMYEKQARFIRAESLVKLNRYKEAAADYVFILNDWTSNYTEKALLSLSRIYMQEKKYNEAVVYLKKLALNDEYKLGYKYAIHNLLIAYSHMGMPDEAIQYAELMQENETSTDHEKKEADLYIAKAYLIKGDTTAALQTFNNLAKHALIAIAVEAQYHIAYVKYSHGNYYGSKSDALELIKKFPSEEDWVARGLILLADNYAALQDTAQAKATLKKVMDDYKGYDPSILSETQVRLEKLK